MVRLCKVISFKPVKVFRVVNLCEVTFSCTPDKISVQHNNHIFHHLASYIMPDCGPLSGLFLSYSNSHALPDKVFQDL